MAGALAVTIPIIYRAGQWGGTRGYADIRQSGAGGSRPHTRCVSRGGSEVSPIISTGDQFLTEIQARMLARLGGNMAQEVMKLASRPDNSNLIVEAIEAR